MASGRWMHGWRMVRENHSKGGWLETELRRPVSAGLSFGSSVAEHSPYMPPDDVPRVGSWRIIAELARGSMAAVFLAVAPGTPPRVAAIKQVHPHLAHDPDFIAMLVDEARIASMIHHPNVVEIREYSLGQPGMHNYLVMEYVDGEPLNLLMRWAVQKGVRVDYDIAASLAADVAAGLHCAHELRGPQGEHLELVHRDVSPQNIMVTYDGRVKLTDFGIAKAVGRLQRTQPGEVKGKLAYMSPEQAFGRAVDRRSDVYSLGIVLFELCLGRRLFGAKTDADTVRNIMNHVIPAPRSVDPEFPSGLEEIILAMLTQDVTQRFQSAGAVERALRAFVTSVGGGDVAPRLGALVRSLEPARHAAKTALLTSELARTASGAEVESDGEAPTLARIDPAIVAAVTSGQPMVGARPIPAEIERTYQAHVPTTAPISAMDATAIGAPPEEALRAIRASMVPTAPVPVSKPERIQTRTIVAVMLVVGLLASAGLYAIVRALR